MAILRAPAAGQRAPDVLFARKPLPSSIVGTVGRIVGGATLHTPFWAALRRRYRRANNSACAVTASLNHYKTLGTLVFLPRVWFSGTVVDSSFCLLHPAAWHSPGIRATAKLYAVCEQDHAIRAPCATLNGRD